MSFNYTAPPAEVIRAGQIATGVLYAALVFVPNVKRGALIGSLGSAVITFWVTSHAKGDLGGLSVIIETPMWAVIGALAGATISFVSKSVRQYFSKNQSQKVPLAEQDKHEHTE